MIYNDDVVPKVSPCRDCEDRQIGCHSNCEGYIKYKKGREEAHNNRLKDFDIKAFSSDVAIKRQRRRRNSKIK